MFCSIFLCYLIILHRLSGYWSFEKTFFCVHLPGSRSLYFRLYIVLSRFPLCLLFFFVLFVLITSHRLLPHVFTVQQYQWVRKETESKMNLVVTSLSVQSNHCDDLYTNVSFRSISRRSFCTRLDLTSS
jgi:hypothetical protein